MSRVISLPCFGMVLDIESNGTGSIISDLIRDPAYIEDKEWAAAIDVIESLVLAHACAGINVNAPAYVEGIITTVDAICNNLI